MNASVDEVGERTVAHIGIEEKRRHPDQASGFRQAGRVQIRHRCNECLQLDLGGECCEMCLPMLASPANSDEVPPTPSSLDRPLEKAPELLAIDAQWTR